MNYSLSRISILTVLIISFFNFKSIGQNSILAPVIMTSYDFRILENQGTRDDYEEGLINFGIGADYIKTLNDIFAIKTGIRYLKIGYKTNEEDLRWPSENDGQGGYNPDPILPFSGTIEHVYDYIQIPINLRGYLNQNKTKLFIEGGINLNFATSKLWFDEYEFTRLNVGVNLGIGLQTAINEKTNIYLTPSFRYFLSSTLKNTISESLYSYGLEFGIAYTLNSKQENKGL